MLGVATLSVAALALAGCAADEEAADTSASSDSDATAEVAAGCEAYADYLGNEGESVEIYTTIIEPESTLFQESFLEFEECTGITIEWNGDQAFEEQIAVRVAGGTAPDLAIFPQPGLLASFAGDLVPASDAVSASVDSNYTADWKNYGTVDGTFYAAPLGAKREVLRLVLTEDLRRQRLGHPHHLGRTAQPL
jgi:alpha-glucoside transport system substrate-binding protein